jgi:hypothetical protein
MVDLSREQRVVLLDLMLAPATDGGLAPLRGKPTAVLAGASVTDWLCQHGHASSETEAVAIVAQLEASGGLGIAAPSAIASSISNASKNQAPFSSSATYRHMGAVRASSRTDAVLNALLPISSYAASACTTPSHVRDTFAGLNDAFAELCSAVLRRDGREVAYSMVRCQPAWARILSLLSQLNVAVASGGMDGDPALPDSFLKASLLNLYNLCIIQ